MESGKRQMPVLRLRNRGEIRGEARRLGATKSAGEARGLRERIEETSELRVKFSHCCLLSLSPGASRWPKRRPARRKIMPAVQQNAECSSQNCVAGIFSRRPPIVPTRLFAAKNAR